MSGVGDERIGRTFYERDQFGAAGGSESCLGCRIDDLQFEAGFAGNARAKLLAVLRRAARGGGNEPGALDAAKVHFFAAHQ